MFNYSFNVETVLSRIPASLLRKPKTMTYLFSLLTPIRVLYIEFVDWMDAINDNISFSSETLMFEYMLRQKYANDTIQVLNNVVLNPAKKIGYVGEEFRNGVGYDTDKYSCLVGYESEMVEPTYDFEIRIPSSLSSKQPEINALIKKYVVLGKKGIITLF